MHNRTARWLSALLLLVLLAGVMAPALAAQTSRKFKFSPSASCRNRNHVGNNWSQEYYVNGTKVKKGARIELHVGDTVSVRVVVTERDKYPDTGSCTLTHTVTETDISKGFKLEGSVTVREDRGRYAGNTCTWNITIKFSK